MNPTPGILYIINGTVKCADREKPKLNDFKNNKDWKHEQALLYNQTHKAWEDSLKDIVNEFKVSDIDVVDGQITTKKAVDINKHIHFVKHSQPCLFIPEANKVRIVELK